MHGVRVAYRRMYADGSTESRDAGSSQRLPQATGRSGEQCTRRHGEARREEATAEAGAIVGDQRNEPGIDRVKISNRDPHEFEILRNEYASHAYRENRGAGE